MTDDSQSDFISQKLDEINSLIINNHEEILDKLGSLDKRVDSIEQKLEVIEQTITHKPMKSDDLRSIVKEKLDLETNKKVIIKFLNSKNVETDVKVFAEYYIIKYNDGQNVNYSSPIKCVSARKYQYWNNGKWIDDMDGYYIKKVLIYNIQKLYLKANVIDPDNTDLFEENQKYINNMSNDKYARLFMRELRSYLNMLM